MSHPFHVHKSLNMFTLQQTYMDNSIHFLIVIADKTAWQILPRQLMAAKHLEAKISEKFAPLIG